MSAADQYDPDAITVNESWRASHKSSEPIHGIENSKEKEDAAEYGHRGASVAPGEPPDIPRKHAEPPTGADSPGYMRMKMLRANILPSEKILIFVFIMVLATAHSLDNFLRVLYQFEVLIDFQESGMLGAIYAISTMSASTLTPIISKSADVFGRPETLLASVVSYVLGTALQAKSPSIGLFCTGTVFWTIGFLGVISMFEIIIADITSMRLRVIAFYLPALPYLATTWTNAALRDALAAICPSWRWRFAWSAVMYTASSVPLIVGMFSIEHRAKKRAPQSGSEDTSETKLKLPKSCISLQLLRFWQMDIIGWICFVAIVSCLLAPWAAVPVIMPHGKGFWLSAAMISISSAGLLCIPILYFVEKYSKYPMFPAQNADHIQLLGERRILTALCMGFLYHLAYYVQHTYLYIGLRIRYDDEKDSAIRIVGLYTFTSTLVGLFIGVIISITRDLRWYLRFGAMFYLLSFVVQYIRPSGLDNISHLAVTSSQILLGIAGGLFPFPAMAFVQGARDHTQLATLIGAYMTACRVGGGIGQLLAGAIWTNALRPRLHEYLDPMMTDFQIDMVYANPGDEAYPIALFDLRVALFHLYYSGSKPRVVPIVQGQLVVTIQFDSTPHTEPLHIQEQFTPRKLQELYIMNSKKDSQAAINSDTDALAIETATTKRTGKKGVKQGFTISNNNTSIRKPTKTIITSRKTAASTPNKDIKPTPEHSSQRSRFYTAPGLRIPLYDSRGKRLTHARDGRIIAHKISRGRVLEEYVRKYAGDAKVQEMEGENGNQKWTKDQIGDWITEVETMAFGQAPKGKTLKARKEGEMDESAGEKQIKGFVKGAEVSQPQRKVMRSMSEEMRALLVLEDEVMVPALVPEKRPAAVEKATMKPKIGDSDLLATTNGDASTKRKLSAQGSRETFKRLKLEKTNTALSSFDAARPQISTHAALGSTSMAPSNRKPATDFKFPNTQVTKAQPPPHVAPRSGTFPWNYADKDLYLAKVHDVHKVETHPYLSAFSLDPTIEASVGQPYRITNVRTLPLPATREHLIVSAHTHISLLGKAPIVHTTLLPHHDLENARAAALAGKKIGPPHRRKKNNITVPFLKPGKHGWDYEKHAWGFEGDKDLETGKGHQIDPRDEELSEKEFADKYPGTRGGVWPCGCAIPGNEHDSEAE
ncbi:ferrioxamine B transporter [Paraconiothyrium brasiliense]|uniref:Ferrioxamine B transporter n=1 Tax=Paraconiothyrium brasiliense TaxID=300254 RepID=A0ABR3RZR2_9PLEO